MTLFEPADPMGAKRARVDAAKVISALADSYSEDYDRAKLNPSLASVTGAFAWLIRELRRAALLAESGADPKGAVELPEGDIWAGIA